MKFAIIAAGEGSRLVQEGVPTPKPLVEIDGKPMIRRLIDIFLNCGAEEIAIIVNEHMTAVRAYVEGLQLPVPLKLVVKSTPSSMHSFYEVATALGEGKFVVTTVDTIFRPSEMDAYVKAFEKVDADGCMGVTSYIDDEKPLYVETDKEMVIKAFKDQPWDGVEYVSAGIYGLSHKAVPVLEHCMETGVSRMRNYQRALIEAGLKLIAYPFGKVIDVDHASDIEKAQKILSE